MDFNKIRRMATGFQFQKIKSGWVYQNGEFVQVWSGASEISVYMNGEVIETLEVDDGDNIIPSLTTPTVPSDATFVGWTDDNTSVEPKESILATGDPITIYAIYKYNDTAIRLSDVSWGNNGFNYQNTKKSMGNIDGTKFKQVRISASEYNCDVAGYNTVNNMYLYVGVDGGGESWFYTQHQSGGIGVDGDHRWITTSGGSITSVFEVPNRTTYIYGRAEGEMYEAHMRASATGIGRTIVG